MPKKGSAPEPEHETTSKQEEPKPKKLYRLVAWIPRPKGQDLGRGCGTGFENGGKGINITLDFDLRRGDRLTLFEVEESEASELQEE